jgi:hypothetical protein
MTFNILLIISLLPSKSIINETVQKRKKRKRLTIMTITITFSFLILTSPSAIISAFLFLQFNSYPVGKLLIYLFDNISFSYCSFNFMILFLTNKKYSSEFRSLFCSRALSKKALSDKTISNQGTTNSP